MTEWDCSADKVEQEAERLLSEFAETRAAYGMEEFPLDIDTLIRLHLGARLEGRQELRDDRGHSLLGGLYTGDGYPTVVFRRLPGSAEGRERFTKAHETGHLRLHVPQGADTFNCTGEDVVQEYGVEQESPSGGDREHQRREWEANLFGAALLMPRKELCLRYEEWEGDAVRLTRHFGVSTEALYWRLRAVGKVPAWEPAAQGNMEWGGIRILHFGDTHLGAEKRGQFPPRVQAQRRADLVGAVEQVVAAAVQNDVDVLMFTGDAFQERNPTSQDQKEFARLLWPAIRSDIQVVLLVGNHDRPNDPTKSHSLWVYEGLRDWIALGNVHVFSEPTVRSLKTKRGWLDVAALPFIPPAQLIGSVPTGNTHMDIVMKVQDQLDRLSEQVSSERPQVLMSHLTVVGAALGSERHLMSSAGRDLAVPVQVLERGPWDYVALGHIHRHQAAGRIVYAGSTERFDFGEECDSKGYVLVDAVRGGTTYKFVPLQDTRRFVTLRVTPGVDDPTADVAGAIQQANLIGAVVRVRVEIERDNWKRLRMGELESALTVAAPLAWRIEPQWVRQFIRTQGADLGVTVATSVMEALKLWAAVEGGRLGIPMDALLEKATELEEDPELQTRLARDS